MNGIDDNHPDGTIRAQRPDGTYMVAAPSDIMFMPLTQLATDVWQNDSWHPTGNSSVAQPVHQDLPPIVSVAAPAYTEPQQEESSEPEVRGSGRTDPRFIMRK